MAARRRPPFLGQGANQALQDALLVGRRLGALLDCDDAGERLPDLREHFESRRQAFVWSLTCKVRDPARCSSVSDRP